MKQKYNEYKESWYEWLGEIPVHWELKKAKWGFKEKSIKGHPNEVLLSVSKGKGVIPRDELENKAVMAFKDLQNFKLVVPKDFVIHLRSFQSGFEMSSNQGIVSPAYTVFSCESSLEPNYYKYLFYMRSFIDSIAATTQSLRDGKPIAYKDFSNMELPFPTIEEQTKIATFLDFKLNEIDNLINMKNKFIKLLEQQRQSIITEAVTKGLNPNVKMKDSGIEWIGEIPEHWEIKKVKHALNNLDYRRIPLSSEERGKMSEKTYDYYGASGVIDKVDNYLFDETLILIGEDGANLFSRSTPLAFLAKGKYWVNNHAHILKPKIGSIDYFVNLLESMDYSIYISGSAQPKLTQEALGNISILLPPIEEQFVIGNFVNNVLNEHNKVISMLNIQIEKLKEYRQTLIYEAVTGKIDIRDMELD